MNAYGNNLQNAKHARDDEFYTPYDFVCSELDNYSEQFHGKIICCPCDDPRWSNFVRYFVENRARLGIKAVYCSFIQDGYCEGQEDLSTVCWAISDKNSCPELVENNPDWRYVCEDAKDIRAMMISLGWKIPAGTRIGKATAACKLEQGVLFTEKGSYDSASTKKLIASADIVVTNPPFSSFGKFFEVLLESKKKFLIVGSMLALTHKVTFDAWKEGKVWGGYNCHKNCDFFRPDGTVKTVGVTWYTNMIVDRVVSNYKSGKTITDLVEDGKWQTLDRYPEVLYLGAVADYPDDYKGKVAIPVNAFYRFNVKYFDIFSYISGTDAKVNGQQRMARLIVKRKDMLSLEDQIETIKQATECKPKVDAEGYVYAILDSDSSVKIGVTTTTVGQRLKQLQTGNASKLIEAKSWKVNKPYEVEAQLHQMFAKNHRNGEWFDDSILADVEQVINKELEKEDNEQLQKPSSSKKEKRR